MEFLQQNWFSLLMIAVLVIDRAVSRGRKDGKMEQVISKVDEFGDTLDAVAEDLKEHVATFNAHVADPDIHVNRNLRDLFESRFKLIETGVQTLQKTLDKM